MTRLLSSVILVCVLGLAAWWFYADWAATNPFEQVQADVVEAFCLCDLSEKTGDLTIALRISDRDFIQDLVRLVFRPRLKPVVFVFSMVTKPAIFIDKQGHVLVCVKYHPNERQLSFYRVFQKNGKLIQGDMLRGYRAVVGDNYERAVVGYLDKQEISKAFFYGRLLDGATGKPLF